MPVVFIADDSLTILAQVASGPGSLPERIPGCTVVTFPDGLALVSGLRGVTPDLVIIDMRLPELDGFDLLRSDHIAEHIPVIAVSGMQLYLDTAAQERNRLWTRARFATVFKDDNFLATLADFVSTLLGQPEPADPHPAAGSPIPMTE